MGLDKVYMHSEELRCELGSVDVPAQVSEADAKSMLKQSVRRTKHYINRTNVGNSDDPEDLGELRRMGSDDAVEAFNAAINMKINKALEAPAWANALADRITAQVIAQVTAQFTQLSKQFDEMQTEVRAEFNARKAKEHNREAGLVNKITAARGPAVELVPMHTEQNVPHDTFPKSINALHQMSADELRSLNQIYKFSTHSTKQMLASDLQAFCLGGSM